MAQRAEDLKEMQGYQLCSSFIQKSNQLREGKFGEAAGIMAACALAMLPMLLEQQGIHTKGMVDAMVNMGPGAMMGASLGDHIKPFSRLTGKDVDDLSGFKGKALKVGNTVASAALFAAGKGVDELSRMSGQEVIKVVAGVGDDVVKPAVKAVRMAGISQKAKAGISFVGAKLPFHKAPVEKVPPITQPH